MLSRGEWENEPVRKSPDILSSVRAHKLRSILTMLGIIIGVGSVIVVVAVRAESKC